MSDRQEINRGYIDYLRELDPTAERSSSRQISSPPKNSFASEWLLSLSKSNPRLWKGLVLTLLVSCGVVMFVILRSLALFRRLAPGSIHDRGLDHVDQFVEQYPFHLYPLLAKCMENAYFDVEFPKLVSPETRVVELAVGDGTFSEKIYPAGTKIVAVDISPYSLRLTAAMPHVKRAVVSDCLNPAVRSGAFDLLVTNNFLHHVTDKRTVLDHIARISKRAAFNENSTYWASAWPGPFLLGRLGLKTRSKQAADAIERHFLQSLLPRPEIDALVSERFNILSSEAYYSEKTYFLCTIFSRIMGCYGPPTPSPLKAMFLGRPIVRRIVISMTRALARALIEFDSHQDKSRGAFISYVCESRSFQASSGESDFVCVDCGTILTPNLSCPGCSRQYPSAGKMAFILPREIEFIHSHYSGQNAYDAGSAHQHH